MSDSHAAQDTRGGTGERAAILARVREALTVPTSIHVQRDRHLAYAEHANHAEESDAVGGLLPPVGASLQSRIDRFQERSESLRSNFLTAECTSTAAGVLGRIATDSGWKRVAVHNAPLLDQIAPHLPCDRLQIGENYDREALEQCDAGITVCDALIAQTGSVLLTATSAGGRALSVLPPHHVVIATAAQLLPDLPSAFALLASTYGKSWPSFATIITGPSRTGDIERILVLGAHGPKQLTVILINQNQEQ
ncbi:MAG TPA: lactate utilization protein [Tepidisphaeraceae bacterium]|nr:lactate utilization protein [Tepidisphaeraceae bacterium]